MPESTDSSGPTESHPEAAEPQPRLRGLRRDLTADEMGLLSTIFEPLYSPRQEWPIWDYVSRSFYRNFRLSAEDVLSRLPTVRFGVGQFGLVWRSESFSSLPNMGESVGLSVAGLVNYGTPSALDLAEFIVSVGRTCGLEEAQLISDPYEVANSTLSSNEFSARIAKVDGMPLGLPLSVAFQTIQREPLMPSVSPNAQDWTITLHARDRQLIGVTNVHEYLDLVENHASAAAAAPAPRVHPLSLAQTLDYLAVVAEHSLGWPHLLGSLRASDVGQLSLAVNSREDFNDRLSALCTVLALSVPKVEPDVLTVRWMRDDKPGSLQRLRLHLENRLGDDLAGESISQLQAVLRVRASIQHPTPDAVGAHTRLGLTYPIRDWASAWLTIQHQVIRALDELRELMQADTNPDEQEVLGL